MPPPRVIPCAAPPRRRGEPISLSQLLPAAGARRGDGHGRSDILTDFDHHRASPPHRPRGDLILLRLRQLYRHDGPELPEQGRAKSRPERPLPGLSEARVAELL